MEKIIIPLLALFVLYVLFIYNDAALSKQIVDWAAPKITDWLLNSTQGQAS